MLRSVSRRRNRVLKWRTAASAGLEVELVDQDEGALHPGADRPDRHRGARDVDDVLVDADRIQHGLALVLRIEPLRPHLAPLALPVHQYLDVGHLAVLRHADEVGDQPVLADGLLKDGVAVNLAVGFRLEGAEAFFGELPADRSEEHTSELQSRPHLVCRLLLEKKKTHESTYTSAHTQS